MFEETAQVLLGIVSSQSNQVVTERIDNNLLDNSLMTRLTRNHWQV